MNNQTINLIGQTSATPFLSSQIITARNVGNPFTSYLDSSAFCKPAAGAPAQNAGHATTALAIAGNLDADQSVQDSGYDVSDSTKSMASGNVAADFEYSHLALYDASGQAHQATLAYLKTDDNTWSVEIYANHPEEIAGGRPDGLLASGTLDFNPDGTLKNASDSLKQFDVRWSGSPGAQAVSLNWNDSTQFVGPYTLASFTQDGAAKTSSQTSYTQPAPQPQTQLSQQQPQVQAVQSYGKQMQLVQQIATTARELSALFLQRLGNQKS